MYPGIYIPKPNSANHPTIIQSYHNHTLPFTRLKAALLLDASVWRCGNSPGPQSFVLPALSVSLWVVGSAFVSWLFLLAMFADELLREVWVVALGWVRYNLLSGRHLGRFRCCFFDRRGGSVYCSQSIIIKWDLLEQRLPRDADATTWKDMDVWTIKE